MAQGTLSAQRPSLAGKPETATVTEGSLVACAAYLSATRTGAAVRAAETCQLLAFGPAELDALLRQAPQVRCGSRINHGTNSNRRGCTNRVATSTTNLDQYR